jgi:hypothetical protein
VSLKLETAMTTQRKPYEKPVIVKAETLGAIAAVSAASTIKS